MSGEMGGIQAKAIAHGFKYWRVPDAHGVKCTALQAVRLLQDLIGVEVEIDDQGDECCPACAEKNDAYGSLAVESMMDQEQIRRLRIANLRRMADVAFMLCAKEEKLARTSWEEKWKSAHARKAEKFIQFCRACRVEIARLRGEG